MPGQQLDETLTRILGDDDLTEGILSETTTLPEVGHTTGSIGVAGHILLLIAAPI